MNIKRSLIAVALAATAALPLAGCGSRHPSARQRAEQRLATAMHTWRAAHAPNYRLSVSESCFCPPTDNPRDVVVVRAGHPVSRASIAGSVEELFQIVADGLRSAHSVSVTYDRTYGYPRTITIVQSAHITDSQVSYSARLTP